MMVKETPVAASEAPAEEGAAGTRKYLSPEQWLEIEGLIERDEKKNKEIVAEYGITPSALSQHLRRRLDKDGYLVRRGSKKPVTVALPTPSAVPAEPPKVETFESKKKGRIEDTREKGFVLLSALASQAQKIALQIVKSEATPTNKANDIKALRHLEKLVEDNINARLTLLEADKVIDEQNLPELRFRDLSQKEIEEIQKGGDDDFDMEALEEPTVADEEIVELGEK